MRSLSRNLLWLMVWMVCVVPLAIGATITGTVKGPDGKPFQGAFVEARNTTTNITTEVLSHENGNYEVPNLVPGTYQLTIRAIGYKATPQNETLQTEDQHAKADFALGKGTVTWSQISVWQGQVLMPNTKGKDLFFGQPGKSQGVCFQCHDFQNRMATRRLNFQGWLGMVNYMRQDVVPYSVGPNSPEAVDNEKADEAANYLASIFGPNSSLPASPADMSAYKSTVRKYSNQAMNIVYVAYPMQDSTWLDFQLYPPTVKGFPSDGYIWVADFGNANRVIRVNPKTNHQTTYLVPCPSAAGIHAIEVGPYGNAWFGEQGCNRVGTVNEKTGKVTQYQAPYLPGKKWGISGGSKHDAHPMLVDGKLYVFASGNPATRLDPATGKFTPIPGIRNTYDVMQDKVNGNVWFTDIGTGPLREVNPRTLKTVLSFAPSVDPKYFKSHRITITPKGIVWVTCRWTRVCRFNPKTRAFKQYTPLGPNKGDYAIQVDNAGYIWYSMRNLDELQRLNPKTGHIVEYPFPYNDITMRRFWMDKQGRIWWASPANAVLGYFYLAGGGMDTTAK